jgi:hypothetical protein
MGQPDSGTGCVAGVGMTGRSCDRSEHLHFRLVQGTGNLAFLLVSELDALGWGRCREGKWAAMCPEGSGAPAGGRDVFHVHIVAELVSAATTS